MSEGYWLAIIFIVLWGYAQYQRMRDERFFNDEIHRLLTFLQTKSDPQAAVLAQSIAEREEVMDSWAAPAPTESKQEREERLERERLDALLEDARAQRLERWREEGEAGLVDILGT